MKTMELKNLKSASAEELTLRFQRASLVVLLGKIKLSEKRYERATGKKAPSLIELIKEQI